MGTSLQPSAPHEAIELFLRKLTEHAFSGLLLLDGKGIVRRASPSVQSLLGYDITEVEGSSCFDWVHSDDLDRIRRRFEETLSRPGVPVRDTLRVRSKSGGWTHLEVVSINRLLEPDVEALVVTYQDVTSRDLLEERLRTYRRAQQALRLSSGELLETSDVGEIARRIVNVATSALDASAAWVGEAMPDGSVAVLAASDSFAEYVTKAAVRWDDTPHGRGPTGRALRTGGAVVCDHIDEADFAPWRELATAHGLACSAAFPLTSRSGTFGALNMYSTRPGFFTYETLELIDAYARQAGLALENARLVTSLRESEKRFRRLFEESRDAIFLARADSLEDANPAMLELFGILRDQVASTDIGRFFVDPGDRDRMNAAIAAHGAVRDFETRLQRTDGTVLDSLITASARRDDDGRISGIQGIVRDVTERRRLEERLRTSERLEAVGRLAGGVAHDYNNMLTAILGFTGLLEQRFAGDADAMIELREIRSAAQRAAELTRQLLAFSRRQVLQPARVNMNQIVLEMHRLLQHMVGEDVRLVLELASVPMPVTVDPSQLEQVILNLVANGRHAMAAGGTLTIATAAREGETETPFGNVLLPPGRYVALSVSDTGTGIPPSALEHIFEPFFTTKETGTGLGLATVYGIVSQSAGHISVESAPGSGTTFTILLPYTDGAAEPAVRIEHLPATDRAGSETVLVVDDQPSVLNVVRHILERAGYRVVTATDAESAVAAAHADADSIALVLTDVVLPGVDGREVARRVRDVLPAARVLFMSGYVEEGAAMAALSDPRTAFLPKPFTTSQLRAAVRALLDTMPS
jgi:PAS domain S-box-containing protein